MSTNRRAVLKATTWQTSGLLVMSLLGYAMTGSWELGGQIALLSTAVGFVAYFIHEKLWALADRAAAPRRP